MPLLTETVPFLASRSLLQLVFVGFLAVLTKQYYGLQLTSSWRGLGHEGDAWCNRLGPDNITYNMIQHLVPDSLSKLLAMYNEIWTTHTFPQSWHFAHVIPIPKKTGRLTDPSAFRPIAFTSCLEGHGTND